MEDVDLSTEAEDSGDLDPRIQVIVVGDRPINYYLFLRLLGGTGKFKQCYG